MGYSCRKDAMDLLEKNFVRSGASSNVFENDGLTYMYEIENDQENEAGDIMGTVFVFVEKNMVHEVGNFFIAGDGKSVIAPICFAQFFRKVAGVDVVIDSDFQFPEVGE